MVDKKKRKTNVEQLRKREKRTKSLMDRGAGEKGARSQAKTEIREKKEGEIKGKEQAIISRKISEKKENKEFLETAKPLGEGFLKQEGLQKEVETPLSEQTTGEKIKGIASGEFVQQLAREEGITEIKAGTVPIGLVGGTSGAGLVEQGGRTINVGKKIIQTFPTTLDDVLKYGKNIIKEVPKTKGGLKKWGVATLGTIYAINEFVLNPNELSVWAAVDNVASATPFQMNDLLRGVEEGSISIGEADEVIAKGKENIIKSKQYVNTMTMINPKLWAGRKILMEAINTAENSMAIKELRFEEMRLGIEAE